MADNKGLWTTDYNCQAAIPAVATEIGTGTGNINLQKCLVPTYVSAMVMDPLNGTEAATGYTIFLGSNGRITISAPFAELSEVISVTR